MWSAFYSSSFLLIYLFSPATKPSRWNYSYISLFIGLILFYRWPTWIRNTGLLGIDLRTVYADANIDVSIPTFILQECLAAIVVWSICEILVIWTSYLSQWRKEVTRYRNIDGLTATEIYQLTQMFSRQFIHWQICSILLAFAFLPYTFFFWRYVVDYGDARYLPHAIIMHLLWGACWVTISAPLLQTWYEWVLGQTMSLAKVKSADGDTVARFPDAPIGALSAVASAVVAIAAFGSPILKAIVLH
jgi:hypothetical protein